MVIAFPIGLLVTAVIFDVLHFVSNNSQWTLISYYMIGQASSADSRATAEHGARIVVLGVALAAVTAWMGGELVERLGVTVDDRAHLDAPSSLSGQPTSVASRPSSVHGRRIGNVEVRDAKAVTVRMIAATITSPPPRTQTPRQPASVHA
jgi:hypothetical protein